MTSPKQPENDVPSVLRGGGRHNNHPVYVRAANRVRYTSSLRNDYAGFRCTLRGREPVRENP
jgi:formylglycine-generating enzyme required for sulfatase activity